MKIVRESIYLRMIDWFFLFGPVFFIDDGTQNDCREPQLLTEPQLYAFNGHTEIK